MSACYLHAGSPPAIARRARRAVDATLAPSRSAHHVESFGHKPVEAERDTIAYGARLSSESRRLFLEAGRHVAELLTPRA